MTQLFADFNSATRGGVKIRKALCVRKLSASYCTSTKEGMPPPEGYFHIVPSVLQPNEVATDKKLFSLLVFTWQPEGISV